MRLEFIYKAGMNSKFVKDAFDMQIGEKINVPDFGEGIIINAKVSEDGSSVLVCIEIEDIEAVAADLGHLSLQFNKEIDEKG